MAARKPKGYKVIGALAIVRKAGAERYLYQGAIFPADAIDEDNAKHLTAAGLIVAHEIAEPAEVEPEVDKAEEKPDEKPAE